MDGAEIDHIELFGPPGSSDADSRNFVLCPGGAYDRSPCGTGTSAKLACLAADGKLRPGERWVQESVIGSRFEARYRPGANGGVIPRISGRAFRLQRQRPSPGCGGPVSRRNRDGAVAGSGRALRSREPIPAQFQQMLGF